MGDLRGEAKSLTCVANVLQDQGDLTEAKKMHEKALGLAQTIGGKKDMRTANRSILETYWLFSRTLKSPHANTEQPCLALEIGDKPDSLLARNNIGTNLIVECDFKQARTVLERALQTAREIDDRARSDQHPD